MRRGDEVIHICFHGIGTPRRTLEDGEAEHWIDPGTFHALLDEVAGRPDVRLSFDDGNVSDVEVALPALVERGLKASFFPLAGRLGSAGSLGKDDVRDLAAAGMTLGSHGMAHRSWRALDAASAREELVVAREILSETSGSTVTTVACPFGGYDRALLTKLRHLGYRTVFTSDRRRATDGAWLQPRYSVLASDTVRSVRAQVLAPPPWRERIRGGLAGRIKRWR